ncbi:hypothetical protein KGF57_000056 [Candida theae]|uniref:CAP-Gly domain-containing protein n=1 Tax=Candida theae TaxID=1198502 RepID=A0AAD5G1I9_9ASCO|nr:uncharacterized protein KGF57_000056 [Candida theae]KAI5968941.1 hypothetical protein KGF57_000056 [Candida theae]
MSDLIGLRVSVPNASGHGYIRYIGPIRNKSGLFAGLELQGPLATSRGKNSGSVEGVQYFTVSIPKSGLFLPYERLRSSNPQLPDVASVENGRKCQEETVELTTPLRPTPVSRFSPMSKPPYHSVQRSSAKVYRQSNGDVTSSTQQGYHSDHHRRESSWSIDQHRSEMSTTPLRSPLTPSNTYHDAKLDLLDDQLYKSENNVHNYEEQIEELKKLIRDKDRRLENFNKQREEWHSAMDNLLAVQQDGMTVFEERLQELESVNKDQAVEISTLTEKLKISNERVEELEKECSELRAHTSAAESFEESSVKIRSLEETCKDYSDKVEQLQNELETVNKEIAALKNLSDGAVNHATEGKSRDALATSDRLISLSTVASDFGAARATQSDEIQDLPIYKPSTATDPSAGRSGWCGLCERDGHSSINCPFENEIF